MDYLARVESASPVRVRFNRNCYTDNLTGRYQLCEKGDYALNGGIAPYTGYVGGPNTFKSTLADTDQIIMAGHYGSGQFKHDSETSATVYRTRDIARHICKEIHEHPDIEHHPLIKVTDIYQYTGSEILALVKSIAEERAKDVKKLFQKTPFVDSEGKTIETMVPFGWFEDSLSAFIPDKVADMQKKNAAGSAGQNMYAMSGGSAKTQMISEFPTMIARSGMMFFQSAHLGEKYQLDPYAPKVKKLGFMSQNLDIKFTAPNFLYLPNDLYWVAGAAPLLHQKHKTPEYPLSSDDNIEKDSDLMLLTQTNLRGKNGPSGVPTELVVSQAEGFMPVLTDFRFIKESESGNDIGYGFHGNTQNFRLDLYPDCALAKHTVRAKIDDDPKLCRAIRITADMCVMKERWKRLPPGFLCTPEELYKSLKDQGYDWDRLLATRGYWTFDHYTHPIPPLSTWDLLRMRLGLYRPFWYD